MVKSKWANALLTSLALPKSSFVGDSFIVRSQHICLLCSFFKLCLTSPCRWITVFRKCNKNLSLFFLELPYNIKGIQIKFSISSLDK